MHNVIVGMTPWKSTGPLGFEVLDVKQVLFYECKALTTMEPVITVDVMITTYIFCSRVDSKHLCPSAIHTVVLSFARSPLSVGHGTRRRLPEPRV